MADLIDRAALIEMFMPLFYNAADIEAEAVIEKIKTAPAVDAVEVVRCKDCKKSGMYAFGCDVTERLACLDIDDFGCVHMATSVEPLGFCSDGERRTDA